MFSLVRLLWHSYLPHVKDEPSNRVPACMEDQNFLVKSIFFGSKTHYEFPQGGIFLPHEYCIHTQYIVCLSSDLQRITYCMRSPTTMLGKIWWGWRTILFCSVSFQSRRVETCIPQCIQWQPEVSRFWGKIFCAAACIICTCRVKSFRKQKLRFLESKSQV